MGKYPLRFEELYVVSDIHMGGRKNGDANFQIFKQGDRLSKFVGYVAAQRPNENVALVLNGDVVDSLAENEVSGYVALDAGTAEAMMQHLYTDPSFKPVWTALAAFIQTPKRYLIFVVGNHDIELSLPTVEASIRKQLCGTNTASNSRLIFATHGEGFACYVGTARVFCTHGNEVDGWNIVDYNLLGQLANAINGGRAADPSKWQPNAGTHLVIDVMNKVKLRYPFVDLLKPEVAATAGVIVALDPSLVKGVTFSDAFQIISDKVAGSLVTRKLLGSPDAALSDAPSNAVVEEVTQKLLGPSFSEAVRTVQSSQGEDDLLLAAEAALGEGRSASSDLLAAGETGTLGWWDIFTAKVGLVGATEGLRRALVDWLKDDRTYAVDTRDDLYNQMQDRVGDGVDFVITGHTHLARALLTGKNRFYYNTGTWIRLIRLTEDVLVNTATFEAKLWQPLTSGRMADLDKAKIPGKNGVLQDLVFDRTNAVRISTVNGTVTGNLLRVTDKDNSVALDPEPGTQPFIVG